MIQRAPDTQPDVPVRGEPLLVVAMLPPDIHAWADGLRREHYPPLRNRMAAHITLFHGLPSSGADEVHRLLARIAASHAPLPARFTGLMDLGEGTALALDCPGLLAVHADLADRLAGLIQQKDTARLQPHVTVQARVSRQTAKALQADLAAYVRPQRFRLPGLATHRWNGEIWRHERSWPFRG